MAESNVQHLFWTGGWDSTFRLLQLLDEEKIVQPYYLIDSQRRSTGAEIFAMYRLKQCIQRQDPAWRQRLRPTRYQAVEDIPPDPKITAAYNRIRRRKYIGSQYEWLARYCAANEILNMECGYQDWYYLENYYAPVGDAGTACIIDPKYAGSDEYLLFRWYVFGNSLMKKVEMQAAAEKAGWMDILRRTWFCHEPLPGMVPCGMCSPCCDVMELGMGWRLTPMGRARYFLPTLEKVRRVVAKNDFLYRAVIQLRGQASPGGSELDAASGSAT